MGLGGGGVSGKITLVLDYFSLNAWLFSSPQPLAHGILIHTCFIEKHEKIFLSETTRPRALIIWYVALAS